METKKTGFVKYHLPCPLCESTDAVSLNGDGSAYCFSCQQYIKEYDMETQQTNGNGKHKYEVKNFTKSSDFAEIIDRNLTESTCKKYGVSVKMDSMGTITNHYYPYHDKQGAKIATKTRYTKLKEFSVQGNTYQAGLFGEHLFSKNKYIIITEGEIDCLSAYQMFYTGKYETPVVSIKHGVASAVKDIKNSLEWLEQFENIIINFDNDTQGKEGALRVAELFSPGKCKIMHLPQEFKDASDCLIKNKIQIYTKAFWEAKRFAPDGIINANTLFDEIIKPSVQSFVQYPFEGLNKMTYGLRASELVTFTSGSGLGKTQVIRELIHHLLKQTKDNLGLLMLEENPIVTSKGIMSIEANQRLHLPDVHISKEEWQKYFDATTGSGRVFLFDHFGSNTIDNIISRVRYLAKGLDCKYIIIDHVSIIVSDQSHGDERKALDEIMTRLRTLVQETGIAMIVVSHLRRPDGKGHEEGAVTSLSQLRGSASIGQLSDMVIGLERDAQHDDPEIRHTTRVRVLKNRFSGITGPCCDLKYDMDTGRLAEVTSSDF
jgi:twinkle protein